MPSTLISGEGRACRGATVAFISLNLILCSSWTVSVKHDELMLTRQAATLFVHVTPRTSLRCATSGGPSRISVNFRRSSRRCTILARLPESLERGSTCKPRLRSNWPGAHFVGALGWMGGSLARGVSSHGEPRRKVQRVPRGQRHSTRAGYEGLNLVPGRDEATTPESQPKVEQMVKPSVDEDGVERLSSSNFDRFVGLLDAHSTKQLTAWAVFLLVMSRLRSFYGVMLGTFVLSYVGNTVVRVVMERGNRALNRLGGRTGARHIPKQFPRSFYASIYMILLLTALTLLSVTIVPRLTVESQVLITKLSEQNNPYAIIAEWMRDIFGEEALGRLEPFLLSVSGDQGRLFAGYPDNYLDLIASKLRDNAARWGEERYARFAKLLQFCLGRYFKGGLNICRSVVTGLTKVLYKALVSLLFSFMVIWDLPNLRRGVQALKTSRLGFAYNTIAPQVATFGKLVGQSFEVQFTIAAINTLLTTAGLIGLGVGGPLILSFIVFVCSFVPVIGVFLSTLPMVVAALTDYGMSKVLQIILMVLGVHAVEAYFLNPQIYASKLKLHPVVVIGVLYMAEHLVGVQGLIIAVPCAVYVINNLILGNTNGGSKVDEREAISNPPVQVH